MISICYESNGMPRAGTGYHRGITRLANGSENSVQKIGAEESCRAALIAGVWGWPPAFSRSHSVTLLGTVPRDWHDSYFNDGTRSLPWRATVLGGLAVRNTPSAGAPHGIRAPQPFPGPCAHDSSRQHLQAEWPPDSIHRDV